METWELIVRESVRDIVARYNSYGDSGRFEPLMELFAADAVMELLTDDGPVIHRGHAEILSIFTGTKTRWAGESSQRGASPASGYVRHRVATHQIDVIDGTHASGYCYYEVIMAHGLDHWGRYFDRYEERDGAWKFVHRKVTREGSIN
jgi:hypothetical protein